MNSQLKDFVLKLIPNKRGLALALTRDKTATEFQLMYIFEHYLKQNKNNDFVVVDVGAGPPPSYWQIARKYSRNVFAVEPALTIKGNVWGKDIKKLLNSDVNVFNGVLSDINGTVEFFEGKENTIISSLNPEYREDLTDTEYKKTQVKSLTYSEYVKTMPSVPYFVKIDVEGAGDKVVSSMNKENAPDILLLEISYDMGNLADELGRLLKEVYHDTLYISSDYEPLEKLDIIREWQFNIHNRILSENNKYNGNMFLFKPGILNQDILKLRLDIYKSARIII
jgi:FkbM family methyltransferase